MNDYEMMNQRVDQLREDKRCLEGEAYPVPVTCEMSGFPTNPHDLRAEARDIEIGAPGPIADYAGWLRACAYKIEELEALLDGNPLPKS